MKISSQSESQAGRVAFLWDESFLWGIMAHKALTEADLPFDLVRAEDIRQGCLKRCSALFVPGGWASNKIKALRDDGAEEIRRFVHDGGAYVGFCGGAGLATQDGLGLLPIRRRPTKDRVPSFSGRIKLIQSSEHACWRGVEEPIFHAWWPSQFVIDGDGVSVLATYGTALPDAFSSDINIGDAETYGTWSELEQLYQINLDPKRLAGEPAVLEGTFGKGTVFLSLVHFDTPHDASGAEVLKNLWNYLPGKARSDREAANSSHTAGEGRVSDLPAALSDMEEAVRDLVAFGIRNFLWFPRNDMLLQWRRGVRGLEYCTLFVMIQTISERLRVTRPVTTRERELISSLDQVREQLLLFVKKAEGLLLLERADMQQGHITYETCSDPRIQTLREELFSRSKSHGGKFKELLDGLDEILFSLMLGR